MTSPKEKKPTLSPALKKQMGRYILLVSISAILFIILSNQLWFQPISKAFLNFYAHVGSFILNIFSEGTSVVDSVIQGADYSISIRKGCDALAPMVLFVCSIIFFKTNIRHKFQGVLIGIPILAVLNIIRIVSLYYIGKHTNPTFFDIMHVDVWQIFFIVFTLFLWVQWLKRSDLKRYVSE